MLFSAIGVCDSSASPDIGHLGGKNEVKIGFLLVLNLLQGFSIFSLTVQSTLQDFDEIKNWGFDFQP